MKEYMIAVFVACAVLGSLALLLYREGADATSNFAFGVLLLFTVTAPLASLSWDFLSSFDGVGEYPSFPENGTTEAAKSAFEDGVRRLIEGEMSLPDGAVTVVAENFSVSEMRAEIIRVYLSGAGAFADAKRVEALVEKYGLGECYADYEI